MCKPIAITRGGCITRPTDAENEETAVEQLSRERCPEATGHAADDRYMLVHRRFVFAEETYGLQVFTVSASGPPFGDLILMENEALPAPALTQVMT